MESQIPEWCTAWGWNVFADTTERSPNRKMAWEPWVSEYLEVRIGRIWDPGNRNETTGEDVWRLQRLPHPHQSSAESQAFPLLFYFLSLFQHKKCTCVCSVNFYNLSKKKFLKENCFFLHKIRFLAKIRLFYLRSLKLISRPLPFAKCKGAISLCLFFILKAQ